MNIVQENLPFSIKNSLENALKNQDFLSIKLLLALGNKWKNIQQISEEYLKQNSEKQIAIKSTLEKAKSWSLCHSKKEDSIQCVIKEIFGLENPELAENELKLFLNAGGNFRQIRKVLKDIEIPHELEKFVIFLDILRRTILAEEQYLRSDQTDSKKDQVFKKRKFSTPKELEKTSQFFHRFIKSEFSTKILHISCKKGLKELAAKIVNCGTDINAPYPGTGATPLHTAAWEGNVPLMTWLVGNDAKINAQTFENKDSQYKSKSGKETPLHLAASAGHLSAVDFLLKAGAYPNASSAQGITPLHYACIKGNVQIAELLINNGANVNVTNFQGVTPLHYAFLMGKLDLMKCLLRHGADPGAIDAFGETPFQALLKHENHDKIVKEFFNDFPIIQDLWRAPNQMLPKLRTSPNLLFVDRSDYAKRNPLEAVLFLGDRQLAASIRKIMSEEDFKFAIGILTKKYPLSSLKLLLDAHLQIDRSFVYKVSAQPEIPKVPLIDLDSFLSIFKNTQFLYSKKITDLKQSQVYFDQNGNMWTQDPITKANAKLLVESNELSKIDSSRAAEHPLVALKIGDIYIPASIHKENGLDKIEMNLDMLLPLFKKINFYDSKLPGYRGPAALRDSSGAITEEERKSLSVKDLEMGLQSFIENIKFRIPHIYTPSKENPEALEEWYAYIESIVNHVIRIAIEEDIQANKNQEKDPTPSAPSVISYAIAGDHCGSRSLDECQFLYEAKTNLLRTLEEQILHHINKFKMGIVETLVDKNDLHNVHQSLKILQIVDENAGITEEEKKRRYYFNDPISPKLNREKTLNAFWDRFNNSSLIDVLLEPFNSKTIFNEELVYEWFKDHVPADYQKEKYDQIKRKVNSIKQLEDKVIYLKQFDIFINPPLLKQPEKINWEMHIETDRISSFMETAIMDPIHGYRRDGVIFLLNKLGGFKS